MKLFVIFALITDTEYYFVYLHSAETLLICTLNQSFKTVKIDIYSLTLLVSFHAHPSF